MIEDPELRSLFDSECRERLTHLQTSLSELEKNPDIKPIIEDIFRDAHTLKGSARMLEISSMEQLAHAMEDILSAVKKGQRALTPALISIFFETVDALSLLVTEAVTGQTANVPVEKLLEKIRAAAEKKEEAPPSEKPPVPAATKKPPEEPQVEKQIASLSITGTSVRIPTSLLNDILTEAGDLSLSKNGQLKLMEDIDHLDELWQRIKRQDSFSSERLGKEELIRRQKESLRKLGEKISEMREKGYESIHKLERVITPLVDHVRRMGMVPLSRLFDLFPAMVRELSRTCEKEVELVVKGGEVAVDKSIIEEMKDPLMHIIRNAIDHGFEKPEDRVAQGKPAKGLLSLSAIQEGGMISLEIADDGKGIDAEAIKSAAIKKGLKTEVELSNLNEGEIRSLIFLPGFSTKAVVTDLSGRGVGMDVVYTAIKKLRGTIEIASEKGKGSKFILRLPLTLLTTDGLLVSVSNRFYAIPIEAVERCVSIEDDQIFQVEGQSNLTLDQEPIPLISLSKVLGIEKEPSLFGQPRQAVVLKVGQKQYGIIVDNILAVEELVVTPPSSFLTRYPLLAGSSLLPNGEICIVLSPSDLVQFFQKRSAVDIPTIKIKEEKNSKIRILIVDDSAPIRAMLKKLFEKNGYEVLTAENGMQAFIALDVEKNIEAIISDVEMPEMDGWAFIRNIKADTRFEALPFVFMTNLVSPEDRSLGLKLGADAYIEKSESNYSLLLQTLQLLIKD